MEDLRARLQTVRGYEKGAKEEVKRHPPMAVHLYCKTVNKGPKNTAAAEIATIQQQGQTLAGRILDSHIDAAKNHRSKTWSAALDSKATRTASLDTTTDDDAVEEGLYYTTTTTKLKVGNKNPNELGGQLINRDKEYTITSSTASTTRKKKVDEEHEG